MSRAHAVALVVAVAGCGPAPHLDAAHLPADALGLIPGVAGEREVLAALPGAVVTRDRSLGGTKSVDVNDRPAVWIRSADQTVDAWLIELGGELRLVWLTTPHREDCAAIAAKLGDHAKAGTCHYSNRVYGEHEHQLCALAADGKTKISIACTDRGPLELWFYFEPPSHRAYRVVDHPAE